ncbi:hypothetical protein A1O1_01725 [Capronia coronata CBS 617.96]|uniref:Chromo domain-containing protein n=1 Tax=Capronia coronata CBS 617.96 TaxID=1182541 RepID=W9YLC4_9EURO|nr:uncharacterized protein A1O1_01725 [Capronia coronata CBS 617.96]EXJ93333.1 hypothetical protein A1O1_01725 [Capronia coronata CBS 617.96]
MVDSTNESTVGDDEVEYEVERILAQHTTDGKILYLVKWLGYPDEQCTWEPKESFLNPQTLADWQQQLAQGDTLDDEEVAALQARMDAYAGIQERTDTVQETVERAHASATVDYNPRFSYGREKIQGLLQESPSADNRKRSPGPLSKPLSDIVKLRKLTEPSSAKIRTAPSSTNTPSTGHGQASVIRRKSPSMANTIVDLQWSAAAHTHMAIRSTQHRTGDRFKNLRHQNNYFKLTRREPAPDISKIERRAADEWLVPRRAKPASQSPNLTSARDADDESWLFVPDDAHEERIGTGTRVSPIDDAPDQRPRQAVAPSHDSSASSQRLSSVPEPIIRAAAAASSNPIIKARNGRTWRHGDVVVHLRYGDHAVGDVKILHLPSWLRTKLLSLKKPSEQALLGNTTPALGGIESYEDTIRATDSLAEHLEVNNVAAVWEYPEEEENLVMILYSCRAKGWRHFGKKQVTMFEPRLHLAFRNKLFGFRLNCGPNEGIPAPPHPDNAPNIGQIGHLGAEVQGTMQGVISPVDADMGVQISTLGSTNEKALSSYQSLDETDPSPSLRDTIFSIAVEDILHVKDQPRRKAAVYIAFAASHPLQATAVKKWLGRHVSPRHIYTDAEKDGWADWCDEIDKKLAIVLFHNERPLYCDLKYFSRYLSSTAGISCYEMSFQYHKDATSHCAISRLFPRGAAIFITERSMRKFPEESLYAMRWFQKSSAKKVESWKMCLMPNAVDWILRQAQECGSEDRQNYIGMLEVIHRLQAQSKKWDVRRANGDPDDLVTKVPRYEQQRFLLSLPVPPKYPKWSETTVLAEMSEDQIDDRDLILLNYFYGLGATKAAQYRKFLVLDDKQPDKTRKHSWHVKFWHPTKFVREMKY